MFIYELIFFLIHVEFSSLNFHHHWIFLLHSFSSWTQTVLLVRIAAKDAILTKPVKQSELRIKTRKLNEDKSLMEKTPHEAKQLHGSAVHSFIQNSQAGYCNNNKIWIALLNYNIAGNKL